MQAVGGQLGRRVGESGETATRGKGLVRARSVGRARATAWWLPVDGGTVRLCVPRSSTEVGRAGGAARRGV